MNFIKWKLFFLEMSERSGHNHCKKDEEVPVVGVGIPGSGVGVQLISVGLSVGISAVKEDDSETSMVISHGRGRCNNWTRTGK
jgi:hypothetical protein